jgi:hypothetical protein
VESVHALRQAQDRPVEGLNQSFLKWHLTIPVRQPSQVGNPLPTNAIDVQSGGSESSLIQNGEICALIQQRA